MSNLTTPFLNQTLPTPLVLASGIWGTTVSLLERAARSGCGAVTAKSCGPVPRAGHVNPSCLDWGGGLINAIGLANPGAEDEVPLLAQAKAKLTPLGVPLIASIFAGPPEEFCTVAGIVAQAAPDMVEVNISCPNVHSEFGEPYAASADAAAEVTGHVVDALRDTGIPVIVKLAPNVPSIGRIARAARQHQPQLWVVRSRNRECPHQRGQVLAPFHRADRQHESVLGELGKGRAG